MREKIRLPQFLIGKIVEMIELLNDEAKKNSALPLKDVLQISECTTILRKKFVPLSVTDVESMIADQKIFYERFFKIRPDYLEELIIPPRRPEYSRLLVVPRGMTPGRAYRFLNVFFPCLYWEMSARSNDFDETTENMRNAVKRSYAVWIKDEPEAEEDLCGFPDLLARRGIIGNTLLEYLLLFIQCLEENDGNILDVNGGTMCTGTLFSKSPEYDPKDYPLWMLQVPLVFTSGNRLIVKAVPYAPPPKNKEDEREISPDEICRMKVRGRSVIT